MATKPSTTNSPVTRRDERQWVAFSPTNSFAFISEGGPGLAEFYEERAARGDGPPTHRHPWPSWELVLEGTIRVNVDGEETTLRSGDTVHIPAGVPHAYVVESAQAHTVGIGMSEGRFARLQIAAAPLMAADGGPDMAAIGALADQADMEILGPPMEAS